MSPNADIPCSIVMPSHNRGPLLERTLHSLCDQDVAPDTFEVIVVNDGSTDDTRERLANIDVTFPLTVIERESTDCRAATRNAGLRAARGEIVIFLDAEMLCPPGFVSAHLSLHKRYGPCVACGWDHRLPEGHEATSGPGQLGEPPGPAAVAGCRPGIDTAAYVLPMITSNVSCRRLDAIEVGGFDETFRGYGHEDLDLGMRLYLLGRRFVSDPATVAYHQWHPVSPSVAGDVARNSEYYFRKNHRRRHVVHFYDSLKCGGVERFILGLAAHLHGRQHVFTVATLRPSTHYLEDFEARGVPVEVVEPRRLARFLADRRADLVHIHYAPTEWMSHLTEASHPVPMLATVHSEVPLAPHPRLRAITCASRNILGLQPAPPGEYRVIHGGVDPHAFAHSGRRVEVREQLGIPYDAFTIGTAARIDVTKLSERMMEVYLEIARLNPRVHILLLGEGDLLPLLRERTSRSGLGDRVHLAGAVRDVGSLLDSMDLCVHVVEGEPFGISVLEALAKGLPVVAPNIGGLRETVDSGVTGFLCDSADEIIRRVLEFADGAHDSAYMSRQAVLRARLFDERRTALKFKLLYDEVLEGAQYGAPPGAVSSAGARS